MSPSANVACVGLTCKLRDIPSALRMVHCSPQIPELIRQQEYRNIIAPQRHVEDSCWVYQPLMMSIAVLAIQLEGISEVSLKPIHSGRICLCLQGTGTIQSGEMVEELNRGSIVFVKEAGSIVCIRRQTMHTIVVYAAYCTDEP